VCQFVPAKGVDFDFIAPFSISSPLEDAMARTVTSPAALTPTRRWRHLFEAALAEQDNSLLPRRLKDAKDAAMDRIEDSVDSASISERKLLLAALSTISELQRLAKVDELPPTRAAHAFGHGA
jgi:hypothetical protein